MCRCGEAPYCKAGGLKGCSRRVLGQPAAAAVSLEEGCAARASHFPLPKRNTCTVLYFGIGSVFLPGHAPWATLLLWVSAHIGGYVAHQLRLPRVIGMLATGLLMRNIPWNAVTAFPARWGTQMRAAALATIFLRCGLELDLGVRVGGG